MRLLTLFLAVSALLSAEKPGVSECFKVNSLIRMDVEHYWANWTNACSYTIDAVYVIVGFEDNARNPVGKGVWGSALCHSGRPSGHQVLDSRECFRLRFREGAENHHKFGRSAALES